LVFHVEGAQIRPEYHVTEIKLAHVQALDCGRGEAQWDETLVQLLDGPAITPANGAHMAAQKFAEIAGAGLKGLSASAQGELFFEFGPANTAARKFAVHSIEQTDDTWQVLLGGVRAVCKPALRWSAANSDSANTGSPTTDAVGTLEKACCAPAIDPNTCCDPASNRSTCCSG
jgi:hypothetical protein